MPDIIIQPRNISVTVQRGTVLLDALQQAGVPLPSPCGGKGTCGKCAVQLVSGTVEGNESEYRVSAFEANTVLACRCTVGPGPLVVRLLPGLDYIREVMPAGKNVAAEFNKIVRDCIDRPLTVTRNLVLPRPVSEGGLSDADRLSAELKKEYPTDPVSFSLHALQRLPGVCRADEGRLKATVTQAGARFYVIDVSTKPEGRRNIGFAVDVGTTTIALAAVDLDEGTFLGSCSTYNDQILCGDDIISRINFGSTPERRIFLKNAVLGSINRLIDAVSGQYSFRHDDVTCAVISANTVMTHMLLGINADSLRLEPYVPSILEVPSMRAAEVGLAMHPDANVTFSRCMGSYLGGDITSGLLAVADVLETESISLFIDIGTNGELVLGNSDFLIGCACSAGPALEGGGIECGMRAAAGAIDRLKVDPVSGLPGFLTVNGHAPRGICGSGLIDCVAGLFRTGLIDAGGKFVREKECSRIRFTQRAGTYTIVTEKEGAEKDVFITERDIENIIRAKAAVYGAATLLLEHTGLDFDDLGHVYIAGGFGEHLDVENAVHIGLFPDLSRERFVYMGNTSLKGSIMQLVTAAKREKHRQLSDRLTYINLSNDAAYMNHYTAALFIPHTDSSRFPGVKGKQVP